MPIGIALELAGYLVSITVCYTSVEKATGRGARPAAKKIRVTKSDYIDIDGITRSTFVTKMLAVHDLAKDYAPGVHSGPSFKLWFTGSRFVGRSHAQLVRVLLIP